MHRLFTPKTVENDFRILMLLQKTKSSESNTRLIFHFSALVGNGWNLPGFISEAGCIVTGTKRSFCWCKRGGEALRWASSNDGYSPSGCHLESTVRGEWSEGEETRKPRSRAEMIKAQTREAYEGRVAHEISWALGESCTPWSVPAPWIIRFKCALSRRILAMGPWTSY